MRSVEDAVRRWAGCKYGDAGLTCDFNEFLDVIFFNLEPLMRKAEAREERRVRSKVMSPAVKQPIIFWSVSLNEVQARNKMMRLYELRKREREVRRRIFGFWKSIITLLFYYKLEIDTKARRKISAYYSKLKKRGFDEATAFRRATGGDLSLTVVRARKRKDVSLAIQILIFGRLAERGQGYLFRSRRIDKLFKELSAL